MASVATVINQALYVVMQALLYPTVILLLLFLGYSIIEFGMFLREVVLRPHFTRRDLEEVLERFPKLEDVRLPPHFREYLNRLRKILRDSNDPEEAGLRAEKELENLENYLARRISRTRIVVRLGPMLGLMGTLIPLGPGLEQLAKGNMAGLATALITAFATTVVGLASAGLCYVITLFRSRWYEKDVSDLEFLAEMILNREFGG
ncbi:MotA/TolQ/ExbB proton channel family protein [Methanopyrus sp.]|jgi:biopolymer transport protein ExbB/TolQ